jgi:hypothetical protein
VGLCLLLLLLHGAAPAHAGPVTAGASGPLPAIGDDSGSVGGLSLDASPGRWGWSHLDATPLPAPDGSAPFPFRLGVADADPRDVDGGRFVPAARYGHAAVMIDDCMIVTHGSDQRD